MELDTKSKIMLEALKLFSLHGYKETNLRDIASNCNLSKSAIYRHFSSKEDLLDQLLNEAERYYLEKITVAIPEISRIPENVAELKEMTNKYINFTIHDDFIVLCRKMANIEQYRNKKIAKIASEHFIDGVRRRYSVIFKDLIDKGYVKANNPELLAFEFTSPITQLIGLVDREPEKRKYAINLMNEHIDNFIELVTK